MWQQDNWWMCVCFINWMVFLYRLITPSSPTVFFMSLPPLPLPSYHWTSDMPIFRDYCCGVSHSPLSRFQLPHQWSWCHNEAPFGLVFVRCMFLCVVYPCFGSAFALNISLFFLNKGNIFCSWKCHPHTRLPSPLSPPTPDKPSLLWLLAFAEILPSARHLEMETQVTETKTLQAGSNAFKISKI